MTTCPEGERVHAWLDGRLGAPEARDVEAHAAACARCAALAAEYGRWKASLGALPRADAAGCPPAGAISGPLDPGTLEHLSRCASCREDLIAARSRPEPAGERSALRRRLQRLGSRRRRPAVLWGAGAVAAALFLAVVATLVLRDEPPPPPPVVSERPRPPRPKEPEPTPAPLPESPRAERPLPAPPPPTPAPLPEKPPPPPPEPERPATPAPPPPAPPTPPPPPRPAETVAKLRGAVAVVWGSTSARSGEEAWKTLRATQARDFAGSLDFRTDGGSAVKFRVGSHTLYLQRQAEASVSLEPAGLRVRLARGEAFFDVTPGKESLAVETAHGRVDVKGTRFLVAAERSDTEVLVRRGLVRFSAAEKAVDLAAGQRSQAREGQAPKAAERVDPARRLAWVRGLEEYLSVEAEQFAVQGMAVVQDAAAAGGAAIGVKGPGAGQAEIRVKRRQGAPYAVWARVHWNHGVAADFKVQVQDDPPLSAHGLAAKPAWQWVHVGTGALPDDPFRLRLTDSKGGLRIDQVLLTTDLDFNPETDKR